MECTGAATNQDTEAKPAASVVKARATSRDCHPPRLRRAPAHANPVKPSTTTRPTAPTTGQLNRRKVLTNVPARSPSPASVPCRIQVPLSTSEYRNGRMSACSPLLQSPKKAAAFATWSAAATANPPTEAAPRRKVRRKTLTSVAHVAP
jgi:hypothetical protein